MYYEVKTKEIKVEANGKEKTLNNLFFVEDAASFAEAEAKVQTEYPDHEIKAIAISRVEDIIAPSSSEENTYYAIIEQIAILESGEVKKTTTIAAVGAKTMVSAAKKVGEYNDTFVSAELRTVAIKRVKIRRFL